MNLLRCLVSFLLIGSSVYAQLSVTVSPPKVVGQKSIVTLALSNGLPEKVESARAAVFLFDEQGKLVSQATRWVVGGNQDKPSLAPGATNAFHFVITADKPFATTNLDAKVNFSRLVLAAGKSANLQSDVKIHYGQKSR
jgi:hypothetical protein